jgi:CrcB protein
VVNAVGAAGLCALLTRVAEPRVRLLLGTGLLGAFTTFSGVAIDAVLLAESGRVAVAVAYVVVSVGTLLAGGLAGRRAAAR